MLQGLRLELCTLPKQQGFTLIAVLTVGICNTTLAVEREVVG